MSKRHFAKAWVSLFLVSILTIGTTAVSLTEDEKSATIAVTGTIGTLNPLLMDNTEVVKYATSLTFLSLVELNQNLEFVGQLADKITDQDEITARYLLVDQKVQQDVPMISAYIISALGATSSRLVNAPPDVFGTFINIHEWDITE